MFSSREEDKYAVIQLRRTQAIGQYIELRVSPLTIEEATKRNISLFYDADLIDSIAWASGRHAFLYKLQIVCVGTIHIMKHLSFIDNDKYS